MTHSLCNFINKCLSLRKGIIFGPGGVNFPRNEGSKLKDGSVHFVTINGGVWMSDKKLKTFSIIDYV